MIKLNIQLDVSLKLFNIFTHTLRQSFVYISLENTIDNW